MCLRPAEGQQQPADGGGGPGHAEFCQAVQRPVGRAGRRLAPLQNPLRYRQTDRQTRSSDLRFSSSLSSQSFLLVGGVTQGQRGSSPSSPRRRACCQVMGAVLTLSTGRRQGEAAECLCCVCPGISSCSHHAVSGTSSQTLSSAVAVMFIPYLQQEGAGCSRPDGAAALLAPCW